MKNGLLALLILSLSLISGCASIVKKPEVDRVKTIAILSLFGNSRVYRNGKTDYSEDWDAEMKEKVVQQANKVFNEGFRKLGWKVAEAQAVIASRYYQDVFKPADVNDALGIDKESTVGRAVSFLQTVKEEAVFNRFFTLKGMHPIRLPDSSNKISYTNGQRDPDFAEKLGKLAKTMKVDAVALVELRYCYEGGLFSVAGTGEGEMTADSSIKLINPEGVVVVNMPNIAGCGKNAVTSERGFAMVGGKLLFAQLANERFLEIFTQINSGTADKTFQKLQAALK